MRTPRRRLAPGTLVLACIVACGGSSAGLPSGAADGGAGPSVDAGVDGGIGHTDAPPDAAFHPRFAYQAIDAPSSRVRLIFDDARQAVYGVNQLDAQIERFAFTGGTWSAIAPLGLARLRDAVMTLDHGSLFVLTREVIDEIVLTGGSFIAEHRADNQDPFCGQEFDSAAAAADGRLFIARRMFACSGEAAAYFYDIADRSLTRSTGLNFPVVGGSADGSRIYIGGGFQLAIYDGQTSSLSFGPLSSDVDAISVSDNASRVILDNAHVYSRSLTFLGNLKGGGVALASHDSHRAFEYREDAPGPRIAIYDLDAELEPGNLYPVIETVPLRDPPNTVGDTHPPVTMASTPDDTVVFVSGDRRLLVVPAHAM